MAEITLEVTWGNVPPDIGRRRYVDDLAADLRASGHSVAIEEDLRAYPQVGRFPEIIAIFIASGAATTLISAIVMDAYNAAKRRYKEHVKPGSVSAGFQVFDSNGNELIRWTIDSRGERIIFVSAEGRSIGITLEEGQSGRESGDEQPTE